MLDVFFGGADRADALVNASELPVIESTETDDYNSELLPSPMPTSMDYDESMQPTIVSSASHQDAAIKGYYLDPFTGTCYLNDGSRPTWIETIFSEYDECCELSWNIECLALNPIDEETYNPSNKPTKKPQMSPTFTPSRKMRPTTGESSSASSYTEIPLTTPVIVDYGVVDEHGNTSQNQIQQQPSYVVIPPSSAVVVEYGNRPYKGKEQKNPEQEIAASIESQMQKQKQKQKQKRKNNKRGKTKKKRQQSLRGRGGGVSSNGGVPVRPSQ